MGESKARLTTLVTGGGGFLGGAIVKALLARGEPVRTFSRGDYPWLAASGVEVHRGDLADSNAVDRSVAGCELVIHTAAKKQLGRNSQTIRNFSGNNTITANVISLSQRWNPHLIMMSSVSVYGEVNRNKQVVIGDTLRPSTDYGKR